MSSATTEKRALRPSLDFPQPSAEEWRAAAESLLKGAPFDKVMRTPLPEGITLEPIFSRDVLSDLPQAASWPGTGDYLRGTDPLGYRAEPWHIAQELPYGEPAEFNAVLLADLMRGQSAVNLNFDLATLAGKDPDEAGPGEVGACGLSLASLEDVRTAFAGVIPDAIPFYLRTGAMGLPVAALFFAWLQETGVDLAKVSGGFALDPLAVWAASGQIPCDLAHLFDDQAVLARFCLDHAPQMRAVGVTTLPYHQAGAHAVEEIGAALASGSAYLGQLIDRGLTADEAARQIAFSLSVGPQFFVEIAKFRALRVLWARVVRAFGGGDEAARIRVHARTGLYNKTHNDPYVNMLRTTTEALSAVIAGVDSLNVGTFDEVIRVPGDFARRNARNTQIILQEECELTAVADPAGGSWAVEWLTDQVAEKAWECFQEIEAEGGMIASLQKGRFLDRVLATDHARHKLFEQRRISLVGTNTYPNADEVPLEGELPNYTEVWERRAGEIIDQRNGLATEEDEVVLAALEDLSVADGADRMMLARHAFSVGATLGEVRRALFVARAPGSAIRRFPSRRLATAYEALRSVCREAKKAFGRGPRIYLTNLGPLRRHKLRADFTRSFFATGGFEIIDGPGITDPAAAVEGFAAADADMTVVCGTDDDYASLFPAVAGALKAAYPDLPVLLAGQPGENETTFRAAGMDDFIFVKSNNYATNHLWLQRLGIIS
jgi:methylmalonyl-CoA mutase